MPDTIRDGSGSGSLARVDANRRLHALAVALTDDEEANLNEDAYSISTGLLTLTTAGESSVFYLMNNEARKLHIKSVVFSIGPSTGGSASDSCRVRIYKNPTAGTIVDDAVDVSTSSNRNFSSANVLAANIYKGGEGKTFTDGLVHLEGLLNPGSRATLSTDEILPRGSTIGITYEPPDGTTSMDIMVGVICHLQDKNTEE